MKQNKNLLENEIKYIRKLIEDISIVNNRDLGKTWDPKFHIRKKQGLVPYEKQGYKLIEQEYLPRYKDIVYMLPEQADELNSLGQQIDDLIKQYNEKYQQYAK